MKKVLAASILGQNDKATLVTKLVKAGINWIHYDVMDKTFVPYESLPIDEVFSIIESSPRHIVDVHLMVANPRTYLERLRSKADYVSFHFEAVPFSEVTALVNDYHGVFKLGIDINPDTSFEALTPFIKQLAFVNIMSVWPGRGGQELINSTLAKAAAIRRLNPRILVQIDGGVNSKTLPSVLREPISIIVSGSYLISNFEDATFMAMLKKVLN